MYKRLLAGLGVFLDIGKPILGTFIFDDNSTIIRRTTAIKMTMKAPMKTHLTYLLPLAANAGASAQGSPF